jgi:hypothetical protein
MGAPVAIAVRHTRHTRRRPRPTRPRWGVAVAEAAAAADQAA